MGWSRAYQSCGTLSGSDFGLTNDRVFVGMDIEATGCRTA